MNAGRRGPGSGPLLEVLTRARELGFLGPGPVQSHVAHAEGLGDVAEAVLGGPPGTFADLGTGGGPPGLVLAVRWEKSHGALVESNRRRGAALQEAVEFLGLSERVEVVLDRAEVVAHADRRRERYPLVTARSFAIPAVTAEIAAGLVVPGGILVVSEPPGAAGDRWPAGPLGELGFGAAEPYERREAHFVVVRKERPAPPETPRATGKPGKRPLW